MTPDSNPELELARELVEYTGTSVFLTGRAGTGKTTFLRSIREYSPKRMVVLAPTGVAAINAGGVTIHSFFQLNFAPFIPDAYGARETYHFNREKLNIIRSLDLLVIDEISMVRADLLDAVDSALRFCRRNDRPFGGLQLLLIGDLRQLSPVIKDSEMAVLRKYYPTPYFFDSLALKKLEYTCIELRKVYRQADTHFITILNAIRDNRIDEEMLNELNRRYIPDYKPEDGCIILTTHNAQAKQINRDRLAALPGKPCTFKADISGDFPEYSWPTDAALTLKMGAQVMFVKNDSSPEKRYYNGKIGRITAISRDSIEVTGENDGAAITVTEERWSNTKYTLNPETQELEEQEIGVFTQYPLKTAWAITVHKSQGLTFEHAVIDANMAFAPGQVYVALSRCRTLEGLVLSKPLNVSAIIASSEVNDYMQFAAAHELGIQELEVLKKNYFAALLGEQFSFAAIGGAFINMHRLLAEYLNRLQPDLCGRYAAAVTEIQSAIIDVGIRFQKQLQQMLAAAENPQTDPALRERTWRVAVCFTEKINAHAALAAVTAIESDNADARQKCDTALARLRALLREKLATLNVIKKNGGFDLTRYLAAKDRAAIETPAPIKKKQVKFTVSADNLHPEFLAELQEWRAALAAAKNLPLYMVLPQAALLGIANLLPQTPEELSAIPGIGPVSVERYGRSILELVAGAVTRYSYSIPDRRKPALSGGGKKKPNSGTATVAATCSLFRQGKTVAAIAAARGLTPSTIEGHLAELVHAGELTPEDIIIPERIAAIRTAAAQVGGKKLAPIKDALGGDYTWGEIKIVLAAGRGRQ